MRQCSLLKRAELKKGQESAKKKRNAKNSEAHHTRKPVQELMSLSRGKARVRDKVYC
jgi:hypothetical protein